MQCNCVLSANIFGILIRDALTIPLHTVVLRSCALLLHTVCTLLGQCNPPTHAFSYAVYFACTTYAVIQLFRHSISGIHTIGLGIRFKRRAWLVRVMVNAQH